MQIWAESGKSALPICNYSQILYQFLTFTQNLKRSPFLQCQFGIQKRCFLCQLVQIYNIIWGIKDNGGITFLTADNKNRVLVGIYNDGVCGRLIHTKLEIKIVVHDDLLFTDIWHHPRGQ